MDTRRSDTGKRGEDLAADYLRKRGYRIIERNAKSRYGEIDIVAIHQATLVFVEVKTRSSNKFGTPLEAIHYFKMKSLIRAAHYYKHSHSNLPDLMRIDAVTVLFGPNNKVDVELIQNIAE